MNCRWPLRCPLLIFLACVHQASVARGETLVTGPASPEVRALIEKGLAYLEQRDSERRLGGICLIAMAFHKNDRPEDHPAIVRAVAACKTTTQAAAEQIGTDIYSTAIALIFLCELDGADYSAEIKILLKSLELRQKGHGGWGYAQYRTGDTSMTQYGVLSAWEARQAGYEISIDSIVRVCNWLLRTQDPSGGWGYQGVDPGQFTLTTQIGVSDSLTAAGLGSTYLCADLLGIRGFHKKRSEAGIPPALRRVDTKKEKARIAEQAQGRINRKLLEAAVERGNGWFEKNFRIDPERWTFYYLYALERYESVREVAEGGDRTEAPPWYLEGYRYLAKTQQGDGSWKAALVESGTAVDTAFAILFLSRSMRKSLQRARGYGAGRLTGGRGLPHNVAGARLQGGKVVAEAVAIRALDLVRVLSNPDHPDYDYLIENPAELLARTNNGWGEEETESLRRIVHEGSPEARIAAVRALANDRNLDHVPTLIYALSDPDWRVVRAADDGLRFLNRKLDRHALPDRSDEAARSASIAAWRKWYRTIRPDAEGVDEDAS